MADKLRGTYRSVYDAIWDDGDFIALGRDGQHLWWVLRHLLGPQGIDRLFLGQIEERFHSDDRDEIERHLAALADHGWIEYAWLSSSRVLVWMCNALEYEPVYTVKNPNHAKPTLTHLRGLPRHPIVVRFLDRYAESVHKSLKSEWTRTRNAIDKSTSAVNEGDTPTSEWDGGKGSGKGSPMVPPMVPPMGGGNQEEVEEEEYVEEEGEDQDQNHAFQTTPREKPECGNVDNSEESQDRGASPVRSKNGSEGEIDPAVFRDPWASYYDDRGPKIPAAVRAVVPGPKIGEYLTGIARAGSASRRDRIWQACADIRRADRSGTLTEDVQVMLRKDLCEAINSGPRAPPPGSP